MKYKTESYRLWVKAVKALRKFERENKLEKNLSYTILLLIEKGWKYDQLNK